MVEMLGTLAVMGILSITAVIGFDTAMNKHYANILLEEAQKRAAVVAGQISFEQTPSLIEFNSYNITSAGEFGKEVTTSDSVLQFGIPVSGVKKKVCQNILNSIGDQTILRRLSPDKDHFQLFFTECEKDNSFLMIYNNDLGTDDKSEPPTSCYEDTDCKTECATCQIPEGDYKGLCTGECNSPCQEGDSCGDNDCVICNLDTRTCQNRCINVEYLESTGSQWINTNINQKQTQHNLTVSTHIKFISPFINEADIVGSGSDATPTMGRTGTKYFTWAGSGTGWTPGTIDEEWHHITYSFDKPAGRKLTIDDETMNNTSYNIFTGGQFSSLWVFASSPNRFPLSCQLKDIKIKIDGTTKFDAIPVHAFFKPRGSQNCLFDKITKKLFCNEGGITDFKIPGNITFPWLNNSEEGTCRYDAECSYENECMLCDLNTKTCQDSCEKLEYLESNGFQWINTGINQMATENNLTVSAKIRFLSPFSGEADIMGSGSGPTPTMGRMGTTYFMWAGSGSWGPGSVDEEWHNITYSFDKPKGFRLNIDGDLQSDDTRNNYFNGGEYPNLWVFASSPNRFPLSCQLKDIKIKIDGTTKFDAIPVRIRQSNCLFDKVTQKLFCNSGTGTLKSNLD